jgi:predicted component of type VI protein secretion system/ribosomal protein S27AE
MQAGCIHCGQQHLLNDSVLAKHSKVQFRCTKCGKTTIVEVKRRVDETVVISPMPSFARADASTARLKAPAIDDNPDLPPSIHAVLTITTGPQIGHTFPLNKARSVIGRKGADVALNDPEVSRHHCLLEVREGFVNLRDLDSTNGTFFEDERVRAAMLQHGAEFRVGSSTLRLTLQSTADK